jgi:hypothetical protein
VGHAFHPGDAAVGDCDEVVAIPILTPVRYRKPAGC